MIREQAVITEGMWAGLVRTGARQICSYDLPLVEMTLEGIEPLRPYPSIGLQPSVELDKRLESDPVHPSLGIDSERN